MRKAIQWLFIFGILVLGACSPKEEVKHVEAFMVHTYTEWSVEDIVPGKILPHEQTGYVQVNSVIEVKDWGLKSNHEQWVIEDFYDLNGDYMKTKASNIKSSQSKIHNSYADDIMEEELTDPATILVEWTTEQFPPPKRLTAEQQQQVEEHVKNTVKSIFEKKKNAK